MSRHDTIAAIATAPGRGSMAAIRVSGPDAAAVARAVAGDCPPPGCFRRRVFRTAAGTAIDEGLVLFFRSPHSYTGEDVVELQGHGGTIAPRRVLEACIAAGARTARRGEFTERAFLNGKLDLDQSSSVLELIDSRTERAADVALQALLPGGAAAGRSLLREFYDAVVELAARVEHSLDVDEDELPEGFVAELAGALDRLAADACALRRRSRERIALSHGFRVVLCGAPNAGKSSLLNALCGSERAIVSSVPGTTRDTVETWLDIRGWPVNLVDTAGIRESDDAIEREGVRRAASAMSQADLALWVSEIRHPTTPPDDGMIVVHSKCDSPADDLHDGSLCVSALSGRGLDALKDAIAGALELLSSRSDETAGESSVAAAPIAEAEPVLSAAIRDFAATADLVLLGNALRRVAGILARALGLDYTDNLLERVFSRFCVGK